MFDPFKYPEDDMLPDYDRMTKLKVEIRITGIPFSVHPAVFIEDGHILAAELHKYIEREVTLVGFVAAGRTAFTETGKMMGFITIEDGSGLAEVSFFPDRIEDYFMICSAPGPVWISGKVSQHLSSITVDCHSCGRMKIPA